MFNRTIYFVFRFIQAKKKEKRKNAAAKEAAVVEPPKTRSGIKNNQTSGQVGVAASGGDKPETSGSEARLREVRWVMMGKLFVVDFALFFFPSSEIFARSLFEKSPVLVQLIY